jgi:hypothetical protein
MSLHLVDAMTALTPVLAPKAPRIAHQLHYWNAVVLAQLLGET